MIATGHGQKRNRKMETAIAALLSKPTIAEAASTAGISEPTLLRWLKEPEFSTAYREARRESVQHAITRVQIAAAKAVGTLEEVTHGSRILRGV